MSGRLRILPHKSWHVWTTENIEKVKRDERLHKEEVEESLKKSRAINAENLLAQLLNNKDTTNEIDSDVIQQDIPEEDNIDSISHHNTSTTTSSVLPIKDIRINRQAENIEYKKEKKEKELLQKKHEGSAPYQLVPDEYTKHTPWYMKKQAHLTKGSGYQNDNSMSISTSDINNTDAMNANTIISSLLQPSFLGNKNKTSTSQHSSSSSSSGVVITSRGRRLEGRAAGDFLDRDSCRKDSADPMAQFLHKPPPSLSLTSQSTPQSASSSITGGGNGSGSTMQVINNDIITTTENKKRKQQYDQQQQHEDHREHKKHSSSRATTATTTTTGTGTDNNINRERDNSVDISDEEDDIRKKNKNNNKRDKRRSHHSNHKHEKKEKRNERKSNKRKSSKRREENSDRSATGAGNNHHRRSSSNHHNNHNNKSSFAVVSDCGSGSGALGVLDASLLHSLRQKRLDRERDAQLKTDLFIAQR